MALVVLEGPKILAGESLSDGLDCSAGRVVKITWPYTWDYADCTFATSSDGNGYNDVMHLSGLEMSSAVFPNTCIVGMDLPVGWLKIRSGSRDRPVIQTEDRTFAVAIDTGPEIGGRKR